METLTWDIRVTFSQATDGWVLSEMDITPKAGPGVLDAVARVCALLAGQDHDWPIGGGMWSGTNDG